MLIRTFSNGKIKFNLFSSPLFFDMIDNGGCYFWHIKSGTIQREMPVWPKELKTPLIPPTRYIYFFCYIKIRTSIFNK